MASNWGGAALAVGGVIAVGGIGFYLVGSGALDGIITSLNTTIRTLLGSGGGGTTTPPTTPPAGEDDEEDEDEDEDDKKGNRAQIYMASETNYRPDSPIYYEPDVIRDRAFLVRRI